MHSIAAPLPEFDECRNDPIAAPVWRAGNILSCELLQILLVISVEDGAIRYALALWRSPCPKFTAFGTGMEVYVAFFA